MKKIFWRSAFGISNLFLLLGIAAIVKGDVEGRDEISFMCAYLSFFAATTLFAKFQLSKILPKDNVRHRPAGDGFGGR